MKWINKSLFRRLLVSYLVIVLFGLGAVGFAISYFAKDHFYDVTQEELVRKAKNVNLAIQDLPLPNQEVQNLLAFFDQSFDTRIWLFDRSGKIVASSMEDEVFIGKSVAESMVSKVLKGKQVVSELEQFEGLDKPMLSVVVPWGKKDMIYGGIVLHSPVEGINKTFGFMRETTLWVTLLGVLITTAMVSYLSWSISLPLRKIERTAVEIGTGNYNQRVSISNPDEIGDLAQTINKLAAKLQTVEQDRERQEKIRTDFIANISHELRTPLTAMQGFLEALQDGLVEGEESRQKYYQVMYQESLHLNRLVDDLMDLVKLENEEVTLYKAPVDLGEVLKKVSFTLEEEASEKATELKLSIPEESLPMVFADKDRVVQIFKNLLKNAVKFTENGEIRLQAKSEGDFVRVDVADTGIGISEGDLDRIWERFFKVDRGRSKANKGTGLGLSIVKKLTELHDGRISVKSSLGEGTTFSVWLPKAEAKRHSA
ncbi:sensor histidine kinase [Ammoniphilus resinae]|uniref:histidine kinase n=1 Tax=Ammoniphilus resinae TaxID=861532 RepID=A0ABS4GV06_9BACL|nr:HAMP domain-containing sensor histidine kinase [Ammoniphilus resinae]MBP1934095.1 signal transduction histidine kinase [Ammoniphilus resinae]